MEQHLKLIRDVVIKSGYEANNFPKTLVVKALAPETSIPTLYRILDNKIMDAQISQLNVMDRAVEKCQQKN